MKVAVTTLAFCVAALLALGLVMLYSSSMTQVGAHYIILQLLWCAFGFALCVAATALDYQLLKKFAWPIFILAAVVLAGNSTGKVKIKRASSDKAALRRCNSA